MAEQERKSTLMEKILYAGFAVITGNCLINGYLVFKGLKDNHNELVNSGLEGMIPAVIATNFIIIGAAYESIRQRNARSNSTIYTEDFNYQI